MKTDRLASGAGRGLSSPARPGVSGGRYAGAIALGLAVAGLIVGAALFVAVLAQP